MTGRHAEHQLVYTECPKTVPSVVLLSATHFCGGLLNRMPCCSRLHIRHSFLSPRLGKEGSVMGRTACKDFVACGSTAIRDSASIIAAVWRRDEVIIPAVDACSLHEEFSDAAQQVLNVSKCRSAPLRHGPRKWQKICEESAPNHAWHMSWRKARCKYIA